MAVRRPVLLGFGTRGLLWVAVKYFIFSYQNLDIGIHVK